MNTISIIIAVMGFLLAVITFFIGRLSAAKSDGRQDGTILTELGYLRSNTDEIKRRLDKQDERDREYISRLTAVEQSAKQAHKRIDTMEYINRGED